MERDFAEKVKRKKRKRLLSLGVLLLVLLLVGTAVLGLRDRGDGGAKAATVSLEIRCDELSEHPEALKDPALADYVPEDGTILPATEVEIVPGESTVFDVLDESCKAQDIQIEYSNSSGYASLYVEGIGYLYEFSAGKYSGWLYYVDGKQPNYGADKLVLEGGEEILWNYTVDYREGDEETP